MRVPEVPVAQQRPLLGEVSECTPPLIETDLPQDRCVFAPYAAQLQDELPQRGREAAVTVGDQYRRRGRVAITWE